MLRGEVLVKHPTARTAWIIDTMLYSEVLVKHPPQLGTTLDHCHDAMG